MEKINILMVEDHDMVREGTCGLLRGESFIDSVYEAWDEDTFCDALARYRIDIILLDIKLKRTTGFELLRQLKRDGRKPGVIAVTGLAGDGVTCNLLKLDVDSILHKCDRYNELVTAIKTVMQGDTYYTKEVMEVIEFYNDSLADVPPVVLLYKEREFLQALADGKTTSEIAPLFKMTPGSVEQFKYGLMKKIGVPNTSALLAYAFRNGIV
jgi:DNA-binding NarL/FixJ family response regulator